MNLKEIRDKFDDKITVEHKDWVTVSFTTIDQIQKETARAVISEIEKLKSIGNTDVHWWIVNVLRDKLTELKKELQ